ncbi:MAG: putative ABC transporter permease, partial [Spirochaetaceae bacterium]|nr:putative ABC transporter permease [Spirochaetaceae bacterium]
MKMLPEKALTYFLYFSIMAFVGWIIETIYRSYDEKKFVNAGFLSGPFLPIYGFGAVIMTSINIEAQKLPEILSWIITLLSPTFLEYFGSWGMEKILKLKLWDYKNEPLNINGRICLKFS